MNYLYLGDCLNVLRNELEFKPESVDLIYIDPPFNSKRNYNVFFDDKELQTQRIAFEDTWSLKSVGDSLAELDTIKHDKLLNLLNAYRDIAPQVFPYVVMMALRIIELHKVLKPTGSFYLHCDPTASHYLKTVCDAIFGVKNFRNDLIWCYKTRELSKRFYNKKHDDILFYSKSKTYTFNPSKILESYPKDYVSRFKYKDKKGQYSIRGKGGKGAPFPGQGDLTPEQEKQYPEWTYRHYLQKGTLPRDWFQMDILNSNAPERLGYPTQKPRALLERIIKASSSKPVQMKETLYLMRFAAAAQQFLPQNP